MNEDNDITIYCCYHYGLPEDDGNKWVYGPNDNLNKFFGEASLFRYIEKYDKDSKYIGLCHYRRKILKEDLKDIPLDEGYCYTIEASRFSNDYFPLKNYSGFSSFCRLWDCEFIWNDFNEYTNFDEKYIITDERLKIYPEIIGRNSFVLKRNDFLVFCHFINGFWDFIDKKYKLDKNPEKYNEFIYKKWLKGGPNPDIPWQIGIRTDLQTRFFAYITEQITSIYLETNYRNKLISKLYLKNMQFPLDKTTFDNMYKKTEDQ